jgi:hypothetical protein
MLPVDNQTLRKLPLIRACLAVLISIPYLAASLLIVVAPVWALVAAISSGFSSAVIPALLFCIGVIANEMMTAAVERIVGLNQTIG